MARCERSRAVGQRSRSPSMGAFTAGAEVQLLDLQRAEYPDVQPRRGSARAKGCHSAVIEACYESDEMVGAARMSNRIGVGVVQECDRLAACARVRATRPFCTTRWIGLISAAGGTQGLQVYQRDGILGASFARLGGPLRGPRLRSATGAFTDSGEVQDPTVELQLRTLGAEVVRVAERFYPDCPAASRGRV